MLWWMTCPDSALASQWHTRGQADGTGTAKACGTWTKDLIAVVLSGYASAMATTRHRKRVKHFHEPGDLHELTFSCYRRMPLLTNDDWRYRLARSLDAMLAAMAVSTCRFRIHAGARAPAGIPDIARTESADVAVGHESGLTR